MANPFFQTLHRDSLPDSTTNAGVGLQRQSKDPHIGLQASTPPALNLSSRLVAGRREGEQESKFGREAQIFEKYKSHEPEERHLCHNFKPVQ